MGLQILPLAMIILLSWSFVLSASVASLTDQSQPCQRKCGDQTVPYPFGIEGDDEECFRGSSFMLVCNNTHFNPPKLFFSNIPILNLSVEYSTAIIQLRAAVTCYNQLGKISSSDSRVVTLGSKTPYTFSTKLNKFTAIGCYTYGLLNYNNRNFGTGCNLECDNTTIIPDLTNIAQNPSPCLESKIGCCQTDIPKGIKDINITVEVNNRPTDLFFSNPCDYGYLAVEPFSLKMSPENYLYSDVAVDWAIGGNCEKATSGDGVSNPSNDCGQNTNCTNSENGPGYICACKQGYKGNPYINCTGNGDTKAAVSSANAGNGDTKAAMSSATADTVQGSYVGYAVLLLLGFVKVLDCYC